MSGDIHTYRILEFGQRLGKGRLVGELRIGRMEWWIWRAIDGMIFIWERRYCSKARLESWVEPGKLLLCCNTYQLLLLSSSCLLILQNGWTKSISWEVVASILRIDDWIYSDSERAWRRGMKRSRFSTFKPRALVSMAISIAASVIRRVYLLVCWGFKWNHDFDWLERLQCSCVSEMVRWWVGWSRMVRLHQMLRFHWRWWGIVWIWKWRGTVGYLGSCFMMMSLTFGEVDNNIDVNTFEDILWNEWVLRDTMKE